MEIAEKFKNVFEPELLNEIKAKAKLVQVKEGDIILDIGQTVKIIPLLIKGILKITRADDYGKELLL